MTILQLRFKTNIKEIRISKYEVEGHIRHIIRRIPAGSALRVLFEKSFGPIFLCSKIGFI